MYNKRNLIYIYIFLSFTWLGHASIGSNTAVSRQAAYALFPYSSIPTNQLLGFTAAQQGIVLGRSDCTASFSDFFPVSTLMDLRGGTLYLNYDLTLDQTVSFASTGSFVASGGSAIYLPTINTNLGFPAAKNLLFFLAAATQTTAPTTCDWAFDSVFNACASGVNLRVNNFNGSTITFQQTVAMPSAITALRWHPFLYYVLLVYNNAAGNDVRTYFYNTGANSLTNTGNIANGVVPTAVSWAPNGASFAFGDTASVNTGTFNTGTGAITAGPFLTTPAVSNRAIDWVDSSFFTAGFATSPQLRVFDTTIAAAATNAVGFTVNAVACPRWGGYIGVGLTGSTTNIRIYKFTAPSTLTQIASLPETVAVNSMDWSLTGSFLAVGLATSNVEYYHI